MKIRACLVALVVAALTFASFVILVAPSAAATRVNAVSPPSTGLASPVPRSPPSSASGASARAALAHGILDRITAAKVPMAAAYLPNLLNRARTVNDVVQPLYGAAPAPMGIGDFGVRNTTGTATGYVLQSSSWQAIVTINASNVLYLDDGSPDYFGIQLNTVMTNTTVAGNSTYRYWIQNVVIYSSATQTLRFIDNIWNFSNPSTAEPATTFFAGNGTPVDPVFYYDVYPNFNLPGLSVPYPFTVHLFENSSLTDQAGNAYSTVRFGYDIVAGSGANVYHGVYDTVLFNSQVTAASNPPKPMFTVNGTGPNPVGLLDDAEVMIGGPGGGSTTTVYAINGTEQLQFFNGATSRYENAQTAWDEGTDTGETVEGLSETYRTAGTVQLSPGPSIPMPFWNATPGGNAGDAVIRGTVTPSNSFSFFNQGSTFSLFQSAWAPTPPSGEYAYHLPPGSYFIVTYASEHAPSAMTTTLAPGANPVDVTLTPDSGFGIYAPLWAWDNAQLANESTSGAGTAAHPYVLDNNEFQPLVPLFGELNDFFFPVFTGIFIDGTTAHVDINQPAPFDLQYPSTYAAALASLGFANTNELGIQVVNTAYVSIWGGSFSGWFTGFASSIPPFAPFANVAFWNVTNSLIADSSFSDQGSALVVALGGNNVIWGNTISTGPQLSADYEFPFELGIQVFEPGDLIYNNKVTTNVPATGFDFNLYSGAFQVNQDDWNLSGAAPASTVRTVNGYGLTGSIVGSAWQCGNSWGNYTAGGPLPYNDPQVVDAPGPVVVPFIETGGDYCPVPLPTFSVTFTESGLASGYWGVALAGTVETAAAGSPIVFQAPDGVWAWNVGALPGRTVTPANGNLTVAGASRSIAVSIGGALAATLNATPTPTDVGLPESFWSTVSGGSGTYTYAWSFGDSASATGATASHAYSAAGSYTVTLWVNDTSGGSVKQQMTLVVNPDPSATASASPTSTDVGKAVAFTAEATGGSGGFAYGWDFGDGSQGIVHAPTHTYTAAGTYTAIVTATDAAGVSVTASVSVTVAAAPTATASASSYNPLTGTSVTFTGASTGGTSPVTYAWSFGDGASSTSQSPAHAFASPGTYTVHFWANDSAGGSATSTLTVVVTGSVVDASTATLTWIVALVAGLAVGVVVGVVLGRRGKGKSGGAPPTG